MKLLEQILLKSKFVRKLLFFLQYLPAALAYSIERDRYERRYLKPSSEEPATRFGQLLKVKKGDRGAHFFFEAGDLDIEFLAPDLVRVHWLPELTPVPYGIAKQDWESVPTTLVTFADSPLDRGFFENRIQPHRWVGQGVPKRPGVGDLGGYQKAPVARSTPPTRTDLEQTQNSWVISSEAISILVGAYGDLTFYDAEGKIFREERPPQRQGDRWRHEAILKPEEHIYGLGERAAALNLRAPVGKGDRPPIYRMWNIDPGGRYAPGTDPLYICIPVYLGLHSGGSYLVFYENTFEANFMFAESATAEFAGGALRYYVAMGNPAQLLNRYTELTGRAPLPARWTLGYHQSRWGYRNLKRLRQEVNNFQAQQLPLSAVHLDIDCQADHRPFTIDPQRFPNLIPFMDELAAKGVKFVAINNPGVKRSRQSNLYLEGQVLNAFCTYPDGKLAMAPVWAGQMAFPDFTDPRVREWWSCQYAYLLKIGVDGFWNDMSEPAVLTLWGDPSLPKVAQHCFEGRGGDHREAHNLYGFLQARSAYESLRQHRPSDRPFIVSRAGWAGLQRYAWTWTGDSVSTWQAMHLTIATIIGLGISGIPFSGPDIGGYKGNPSAELYLRWFQMATFMMFYRTHSSSNNFPRNPWTFDEPYTRILRDFMTLRYRLLPYFYTLAWEATEHGNPPVRPLFWANPHRPNLWDIDDSFLLGDALLVCPVLGEGVQTRSAYLPPGDWYDFWTDRRLAGEQTVQLDAPLERLPLLVKAGSLLPMEQDQHLTLHLYPDGSQDYTATLYSDAGNGYGASRLDRFAVTTDGPHLDIRWKSEGDYEFPYDAVTLVVHGATVREAWIEGRAIAVSQQTIPCNNFRQMSLELDR